MVGGSLQQFIRILAVGVMYGMGEMLHHSHDVEFIMGGASFSGVVMNIINFNQVARTLLLCPDLVNRKLMCRMILRTIVFSREFFTSRVWISRLVSYAYMRIDLSKHPIDGWTYRNFRVARNTILNYNVISN
jgi:hypothetical protein